MAALTPALLALDFDGVLCDGLIEYFQSTWRAYCRIWPDGPSSPPEGVADRFYRLRPVIETGWEMPILLQALLQNIPDDEILSHWPTLAEQLVQEAKLVPTELSALLDGTRDEWIAADLESWLANHRFYPGVVEQVQTWLTSPLMLIIITTKEGRFVHQLLQQQGIGLAEHQIIGKESRKPKAQSLRELLAAHHLTPDRVWFVEDRLKTLQGVQKQPDLADVRLFLAEWGYVTDRDRQIAQNDQQIHLLSLAQFTQDFSEWP
ncbi:haloacid dehalogenase [Leptolyngbya sp. 'hensonii']|uniref:HAD family hydrolase n=1 Tax=Leptolyngbya sp. 'hensonii' TaxID=1922337 RepID=UPI00094FEFED|nr:HAD family hydrolase [Leptolyngbya sp. 'hensonii']OLP17960.1 haloacid dehalogenase [Leptolyngbya sp. 'hensonii']